MKKQTQAQAEQCKSLVIIHCLDFLEIKVKEDKIEAIKHLKEFAKFYNIPLKRKLIKPDLKKSLRKFILNHEGYIETIPNLYNSLV